MGLFDRMTGKTGFAGGLEEFRQTQGAVLLDVRTREEYRTGHVPGSVNLPLDELERISFPPTQPLFVYCHSGARSSRACSWLTAHGYRAKNLGGILSYQGPVEK